MLEALAGDGTTAIALGDALGVSQSQAHKFLAAARDHGVARMTGAGRGSRWFLATPGSGGGAEPEPRPYGTIEMMAEAVYRGLMKVDDETRDMLLQAREIARRDGGRRHLTLVQGTGTDDSHPDSEPGDQE